MAGRGRLPVGVAALFAVFLVVIAYLLTSALTRRTAPAFAPTPVGRRPAADTLPVIVTVTLDARDPVQWRFLDFETGSVLDPPDTAGWDLAARRFHLIAAEGIANLGSTPIESVTDAPAAGYRPNDVQGDSVNPAVARWYVYDFLSHLLEPKPDMYAIRTQEDRYAIFTIVSYYCPALSAGCLTIRYRFPSNGVGTDDGRWKE
jgi:hypothetical protein